MICVCFLRYDAENDRLVPTSIACSVCGVENSTREIRSDGSIVYKNGDRTDTPTSNSKCGCGFKHYWDGKEYDTLPKMLVRMFYRTLAVNPLLSHAEMCVQRVCSVVMWLLKVHHIFGKNWCQVLLHSDGLITYVASSSCEPVQFSSVQFKFY